MIINVGLVDATAIITSTYTVIGLNKLTLKANDSQFDKVRLLDVALSASEMESYKKTDTFEWTDDTLVYMEFNQNLLAGNIGIDIEDVERAILYRAETDDLDDLVVLDANISPDATTFIDWEGATGKEYRYFLSLVSTDGSTSQLFESNDVVMLYDSFYLIDPVDGVSFKFNLNVSTPMFTKTDSRSFIDSQYAQYPITSSGQTRYNRGTISCLLGYMDDGEYIDTTGYRQQLEDVIYNNHVKILKDRAGNVMRVQTHKFAFKPATYIDANAQTISFNFVEVDALAGDS